MNENRLIRRVLLHCVPATSSSIFGDVPDLSVEWAINNAADKLEWTRNRPSVLASFGNKATTITTITAARAILVYIAASVTGADTPSQWISQI